MLAEQKALQALEDPQELAMAQQRCQAFLAGGLEAVGSWWLAPPTAAERRAMAAQQQAQEARLDVFED